MAYENPTTHNRITLEICGNDGQWKLYEGKTGERLATLDEDGNQIGR